MNGLHFLPGGYVILIWIIKHAAAVIVPEINYKIEARLHDGCSVFTAELWAITKFHVWITNHLKHNYGIITDSLSALKALHIDSSKSRPNMVEKALLTRCQLKLNNKKVGSPSG
ncbi:hypothetical protein CHS0354_041734 [Potamilus streckersoni]|uniref:RNase H type-1 domain-containing protein n=1 Tax=Potamilus streckersoni TaxID=2493646 RepID=A0AAE0W642_9BIVA|nr:hypothetical protein CHS0354_041734 [Potamilus streckersoni]